MNLSTHCIHRPVATLLLWLAVVVAGIAAWFQLPISALPTYDTPTISVQANLPGASPETMATSVATALEKQFSTIPGVNTITSTSSLGSTSLTLEFDPDRNIDAAAVDVQAALFRASRSLPKDMTSPPSYRKVNPADAAILLIGINSPSMSLADLNAYGDNLISPALSTINGVAQVQIFGQMRYAVRVSVDPEQLNTRGLSLTQVSDALQAANANAPVGQLDGKRQTLILRADANLKHAADFARVIIATRNGDPVRLGDVAKIEDSVEDLRTSAWINGERSIVLAVQRQPGANTVATIDAIRKMLPQLKAQMPASVNIQEVNDRSISIREAIHDVTLTMGLTIALVILVILLFLRRASATLIPSASLPVSLLGTFALMLALGFSLDNISLMGLTIAIGLVVDDAIVVLENIVRHVEEGMKPMDAAIKGAREVGFTVISISVSLVAVFIPIFFMPGTIGRLFHEFAVVVTLAIAVSAAVSLTLIPLFASRFLKHEAPDAKIPAWSRLFEAAFDKTLGGYARSLDWSLRHRGLIMLVALATVVGTVWLYLISPKGFFPQEDISQIQVTVEGPQDVSYPAMLNAQTRIAGKAQADPSVATVVFSVNSSNNGRMFITLKPRGKRPDMQTVLASLRKITAGSPGFNVYFRPVQNLSVGGRTSKSAYQYTLQSVHADELDQWGDKLLGALRQSSVLADVNTDAQKNGLQANVKIDHDKAQLLGVDTQALQDTLYAAYGGRQVSTIYDPEDSYQVIMELAPEARRDESALDKLYVASKAGTLVPVSAIAHIERERVTTAVNHQGQLPAVTLSFNLQPGKSLSDASAAIIDAQKQIGMPAYVFGAFAGEAAVFQSSQSSQLWLIVIAIAVIYVILGVLYESWIHPITILAGIPSAAIGAFLSLRIAGLELTFIAMVGILLLVGIVKKNAIMMIDFALESQRTQGLPPHEAIRQACVLRFRPIMMTTVAAIAGALPIALGLGAGAELRQPLGVAVVGGLLFSQLITLYVTPVLFLGFDALIHKLGGQGFTPEAVHDDDQR
ncbi:hydrophobic/amphiphilic exporter-1, HAE1 family [Andreprevotia lacus DSM 23236]|jgi:HAE1 family hydrophobic/amphiphilic exporter-1|uniref:Hydrophobic/amphiphilic exporter-1, HAE1 family n=1 Tax=Andreprevotia lacus DSM 23236 TaxID=1121001 RepID=A0A1W1X6J6_9NEIS|nr:efflux RND transporter permease subunit [Andreprevotia lacus]SMC19480.1 hydrophobic/amphiphilic exporter-1, HAE1 family [Andreprevotia lacus DSM 23236]